MEVGSENVFAPVSMFRKTSWCDLCLQSFGKQTLVFILKQIKYKRSIGVTE